MPEVSRDQADFAWLIYDLVHDPAQNTYRQTLVATVYTEFKGALDKITLSEAGQADDFVKMMQMKLNKIRRGAASSDVADVASDEPLDDEADIEDLETA